jgi:two-component system, cell cycle response regulator DivK
MAEHRPLVLIIDDNDDHRSMYTTFLRSAGFRVIGAPDGTSGISQARTWRPDVILMDLYMPGLDGWQACRWLKTSIETTRIPVIALTGLVFEGAEGEAMEAGCDRFVAKGSDPERVTEAIREVLAGGA